MGRNNMANNADFKLKNAVEVGKDTKVTLGSITSSDIDLATGNYFAETLAANTTYTISNAGDVQSFQLEVTGAAAGYGVADAVYDNKNISVTSQENTPEGLYFKPDGLSMYVVGPGGSAVDQWTLSTAFDVSTATYASKTFSFSGQDINCGDIHFKPDGTKMYMIGASSDTVYQYSLSTAWDVSTGSYDSKSKSIAAQETVPEGLTFKPDGTKMYVCGGQGDDINEYNLSAAWDVSTASFLQNQSVSATTGNPHSVRFNDDGTELYVIDSDSADRSVYIFTLSTAYDVSTLSAAGSFYVGDQETVPKGLAFSDSGKKMYVTGTSNDRVYQYTTEKALTITWPSSIEWAGGVAPLAPATGETDVFTFVTDDSGTSYVGVQSADNLS